MVLPHDSGLPFHNPDLNWPEEEQEDIVRQLRSFAWKARTDFSEYRKVVAILGKIVEQAENHKQRLQDELATRRNSDN